jgi:hypothetical protein
MKASASPETNFSERVSYRNWENCRGVAVPNGGYKNALAEVLSFTLSQGARGQLGRDHD